MVGWGKTVSWAAARTTRTNVQGYQSFVILHVLLGVAPMHSGFPRGTLAERLRLLGLAPSPPSEA